MEDCQEWSESGDLFCRVFSLSLWERTGVRAPGRTNVRFCRPGKAKPPPGTTALAKHHLRPARQPCGNGAKVIPTGNRNARQLFRQRFLDHR